MEFTIYLFFIFWLSCARILRFFCGFRVTHFARVLDQCCGLAGRKRDGCGLQQMTYCLQVFTKSLRPPWWPNGLVGHRFAPPDSPPCGFYGERCKSDKGTPHACRLYSGVVHKICTASFDTLYPIFITLFFQASAASVFSAS